MKLRLLGNFAQNGACSAWRIPQCSAGKRRALRPFALLSLGTVCALSLLWLGCGARREPLATFNQVPPFVLTNQNGDPFDSESMLKGKIWVADFIFTTCTGPCPRMSSQMRRVQTELKELPDVQLVSFTVDPENDTPPALAEYAKRYGAGRKWHFLTGPKETLHKLNREVFLLGNVDGTLDHSTRFILIDRASRVRKYYHTTEGTFLPELIADIRDLLREESGS